MSEWQPIETAPKDGTVIFGFWHSDTAELHTKYAMLMWMDCAWFDPSGDYEYIEPTAWMPLPPPPTETPKHVMPQFKDVQDMVNALSIRSKE